MSEPRLGSLRRAVAIGGAVLAAAVVSQAGTRTSLEAASQARSTSLPDRLSDAAFWSLATDLSEPGGYFRIVDNFTSNEAEVGELVTMLRRRGVTGGVYLGVGPEQNFSYIAAVRPHMAFILDIRRQAAMQHLMFKALFELAADRAEFISLLFAKPRPAGIETEASIQQIWNAYTPVATDVTLGERTSKRLLAHLATTRAVTLTESETATLKAVYEAFVAYGPSISTRGLPTRGRGAGVTFADLTGWATDSSGQPQGFLATHADYVFVKGLHSRNLIVPVTGDFGGPKAIRAIGTWLRGRGVVNAFYVSNVEQYLFQDLKASAFFDNVSTLPLNDASVFIRPYSLRRGGSAAQSLCVITKFLKAARAGQVYSHNDALDCPQAAPQ